MNRETSGSNTGEADQYNSKSQNVPVIFISDNDNNSHNNNNGHHDIDNNNNNSLRNQLIEEGMNCPLLPLTSAVLDEDMIFNNNNN